MARYVIERIIQGLITLFIATVVVFLLARLTGDPVALMLPEVSGKEEYKAMAEHLGMDKPLPIQYWLYISRAATGDLGRSLFYRKPVADLIGQSLPFTLVLAIPAAILSLLIAVPVGVLCAVKRDKWQDTVAKGIAVLGQSVPHFWLGIVMIQVFAVTARWLPAGGDQGITSVILPVFVLGFSTVLSGILRMTRSAMLDVLDTDYARLAKIKGASQRSVIWKHSLRNALIPVVTFAGVIFPNFLMGSIVVETVFTWPGVGRLSYSAVTSFDFPLIQGLVLMFVSVYVFFNIAVDISYVYLDPRVRYVKE